MSRPKEFDRAEALTAAKAVFWKKGYDATTTDDLRHAMSIGRQSLYDSFGGKRPLYLEVLQRYNTERVVAHFLQSTMVGMKVTAKAGASSEVLRGIAATALKVLTV
jgi:AcrR family transcriptional regulator